MSINAFKSSGFSERCCFLLMALKLFFAHRQVAPGRGTQIVYWKQEMGRRSCTGAGHGDLYHTGGSRRKKTAEQGCGASMVTLCYC